MFVYIWCLRVGKTPAGSWFQRRALLLKNDESRRYGVRRTANSRMSGWERWQNLVILLKELIGGQISFTSETYTADITPILEGIESFAHVFVIPEHLSVSLYVVECLQGKFGGYCQPKQYHDRDTGCLSTCLTWFKLLCTHCGSLCVITAFEMRNLACRHASFLSKQLRNYLLSRAVPQHFTKLYGQVYH